MPRSKPKLNESSVDLSAMENRPDGSAANTKEEKLDLLITFIKQHRRGRTNVEISKTAKIAPSTISMILSKARTPTPAAIRSLAKGLCPANSNLEDFTQKMLELAGYDFAASRRISESTLERVKHTRVIRTAWIVNEPFVNKNRQGFAMDFFAAVVQIIGSRISGVEPTYENRELHQLRSLLEAGEFDIVVSALLPTFQRRGYMSFSRPLPYLRVPLSAVVRNDTQTELSVKQVLGWTKPTAEGLKDVGKILLIKGEVGDEFVSTFLPSVDRDNRNQVELAESLDPNDLYERLTSTDPNGPRLLLADMATCVGVCNRDPLDPQKKALKPLPGDFSKKFDRLVLGQGNFPVLALYPIAFGLPKGDDEWRELVDNAIDSLMSEGTRILFSLFADYLENDSTGIFKDFILPEDDLVESRIIQDIYAELFQGYLPSSGNDGTEQILSALQSVDTRLASLQKRIDKLSGKSS